MLMLVDSFMLLSFVYESMKQNSAWIYLTPIFLHTVSLQRRECGRVFAIGMDGWGIM